MCTCSRHRWELFAAAPKKDFTYARRHWGRLLGRPCRKRNEACSSTLVAHFGFVKMKRVENEKERTSSKPLQGLFHPGLRRCKIQKIVSLDLLGASSHSSNDINDETYDNPSYKIHPSSRMGLSVLVRNSQKWGGVVERHSISTFQRSSSQGHIDDRVPDATMEYYS